MSEHKATKEARTHSSVSAVSCWISEGSEVSRDALTTSEVRLVKTPMALESTLLLKD